MTDNNHPITPPDDLQEQWKQEWIRVRPAMTPCIQWMLAKSARWGADMELEACCEVLARELICDGKHVATDLRAARRPKPLSLKEQALKAAHIEVDPEGRNGSLIIRALEALSDG